MEHLLDQRRCVHLIACGPPGPGQSTLGQQRYELRLPLAPIGAALSYCGVASLSLCNDLPGELMMLLHAAAFPQATAANLVSLAALLNSC